MPQGRSGLGRSGSRWALSMERTTRGPGIANALDLLELVTADRAETMVVQKPPLPDRPLPGTIGRRGLSERKGDLIVLDESSGRNHGTAELVQQEPSGIEAAEPELGLELQG